MRTTFAVALAATLGAAVHDAHAVEGVPARMGSGAAAGTVELAWDAYSGWVYFVHASETLQPNEWFYLPEAIVGTNVEEGLIVDPQDPGTAPKMFYRVFREVDYGGPGESQDSDGDGLTNAQEFTLGTSPLSTDTDGDGLSDSWENSNGTSPTDPDSDDDGLTDGEEVSLGTNPNNPDSDDDGITDGGENDQGTDPLDGEDTPAAEWFILTGDLVQDQSKTRSRVIQIPPGERRLVIVGAHSDEYVAGWTTPETAPDYNDELRWAVTPFSGTPSHGDLNVNTRHEAWNTASQDGVTLSGFDPSCIEFHHVFEAPSDAPLTLRIDLTATNIGDDILPSTLVAAVLPIEVIVPQLDAVGDETGSFVKTTTLKIAKWENGFEGTGSGDGAVRDDFIAWDKDRFYVFIPGGNKAGLTRIELASENNPDPTNYDDDPTEIVLQVHVDGETSISDSMILVADEIDDNFAGSGAGADDVLNDRTHKVQLDGDLVITGVFLGEQKLETNVDFGVPATMELALDLHRMNVAGVHTLEQINDSVVMMKEVYAQAGLRIVDTVGTLAWPSIPDREPGTLDLYDEPEGALVGPLTDEYKLFIDSTDQDGVNLFFLKLAYPSAGVAVSFKQVARELPNPIELKYLDNGFVHSAVLVGGPGYTPSHELLHILAPDPNKGDHDQSFFNLLSITNANQAAVLWSKRMDQVQEGRIRAHQDVTEIAQE